MKPRSPTLGPGQAAQRRQPAYPRQGFRLTSGLKQWLANEDPLEMSAQDAPSPAFDDVYERWYLSLAAHDRLLCVGPVLVDARILEARFACLPGRCAPGSDRGAFRCCCADIDLPLSRAEQRRLSGVGPWIREHLLRSEPRLTGVIGAASTRAAFWMGEEDGLVARPGGRCALSRMDREGRIRCRLYEVVRRAGRPIEQVLPYNCRLFPLILIRTDEGRTLLTYLHPPIERAFQALPSRRFPCLNNPQAPRLIRSMAATLDWAFGAGFAAELRKLGPR